MGMDPGLRARVRSRNGKTQNFRHLASDADGRRPLGVRLCELEARPSEDSGFLSFDDLGWPGCTPGSLVRQRRPKPLSR